MTGQQRRRRATGNERIITRIALRSIRGDLNRNLIVIGLIALGVAIAVTVAVVARSGAPRDAITQEATAAGLLVGMLPLAITAALATAAMVTATRRHLREFAILVANGASLNHVRGLVLRQALLLGLIGSAIGAVAGLLLAPAGWWFARTYLVHTGVGLVLHPLDVIAPAALGSGAAMAGGWIPAWLIGRIPTTSALAGRVPTHAGSGHVGRAALPLALIGATLVWIERPLADEVSWEAVSGWRPAIGALALVIGVVLLAGPTVAVAAHVADRLPLPWRLAVRDAGRQRTRSAAVVATLTLVVTVATFAAGAAVASIAIDAAFYPSDRSLAAAWHDLDGPEEGPIDDVLAQLPGVTAQATMPVLAVDQDRFLLSYPDGTEHEEFWVGVLDVSSASVLGAQLDDALPSAVYVIDDGFRPVQAGPATFGLEQADLRRLDVEVVVLSLDSADPSILPTLLLSPAVADALGAPSRFEVELFRLADEPNQLESNAAMSVMSRDGVWIQFYPPPPNATRQQAIVVAVVLILTILVTGLATALAATESDADLAMIVALGARPSLRRRFQGLLAAHHTVLALALGIPAGLLLARTFAIEDPFHAELYEAPWIWLASTPLLVLAVGIVVGVASRPSRPVRSRRAT